MANKRKKAVAISYDFQGNPINVPQDPAQTFQPINLNVGNGQSVQMRLGEQRDPAPTFQPIQQTPAQQSYSFNPDGSISMNTQYLNTQTGGVRGNDAYNPIQNTNRSYAYEGTYGSRRGYMDNGGNIEPLPKANNGYTNPYIQQQQPFNYGSSADYLQYANNPNQFQMQQAQPQSAPQGSGMSASSIGGGIQQGAMAAGDIFRGINSVINSIISTGSSLINSLLPDNHNERARRNPMADPTLNYQPQFNNMMENGGNMQQGLGMVVNTAYAPGTELELTPQEVQTLKEAGYIFDLL